ncbi:MAG: hypothetical protein KDA80_07530, partial [Planctomycetaceae bacterium]|nr:hypothetical protein [Planctomycetaceae bacterium]
FIDFTGQLEPEVFRRMARVRNLLQRLQYDLQIKEVLAPLTDVILESYQEAFEELNEQARNDESMLGRYTSVLHDRLTEISLLFPDYGARAVEDWYDVFGAIPDERKLWTDLATIADAVASMPVNARQQVYRYWLKEFSESQHPLLKLYAEHLELQLAWLFRGPNTESRFEMLRPLRAHAMEVYDQALEQDQLTVAKAVVSLLVKLYDKPFYGARHQSAFPTTRAELMALSQDFLERPLTTTHFVKLLPPLADANTAKAIDQLLNGYLQVCEEHPERLWLTRAAEDEAKQIRELRSLLLRDWPGPLGDQPTIDLRTTLLLDVESFGGQTPIPIYPRALNETLHTLVYRPDVGRRNAVVQLVSVPLKGGKPRMGGVLFHPHSGSYYSMMKNDLTAACVTDQGMFLSSRQYGLVRFDFERPVAEILPLSANLPQEPISALTEVDGTLYAGTRDGSLLRFGILSSEPEILASSRRQQAVTPLDGRPGLQFNELLHDAPRKRLLIVLHDDPNRVNELWSMTLDDLEFQRLLTIPNVNQPPDAWLNGETLILARDWIVRWDLAKDQGSLTGSYALGDLSPTRELALPFVRRVAFCQDAIWWLAQTGGLYHLSPGTDPPQAHFPDFGGKRENSPGSDANYLSSIDDWRFLASYNGRVWLVEPQLGNSDNSNQEKTPTQ